MKATCLRQPFAELVASGRRTVDPRRRSTSYRGDLAIVSNLTTKPRDVAAHPGVDGPRGCVVAVVVLVDVRAMDEADCYRAALPNGTDVAGLFAWVYESPRRCEARTCEPQSSTLFDLDDSSIVLVEAKATK